MFELIIILCRYLFIFYIVFFIWQSACYIMAERGLWTRGKRGAAQSASIAGSKQRITIIFFHLTAFLILSYVPNTFTFNLETLITGVGGLALLIIVYFASEKIYKNGCALLWNCVFFLLDIGLVTIHRLLPELAIKQLGWFAVGFAFVFLIPVVLKIILRSERFEIVYLVLGIGILLLPFFFGEKMRGAYNWVNIYGYSFQPSEIVKFIFIFYLASVLRKKPSLRQLIFVSVMSAGFVLILAAQNDLGGALIFFMTFMVMLYICTASEILLLSGLAAAAAAAVAGYRLLHHVRVRFGAWLNPWDDPSGGGYQIIHAMFAMGTWGFWGSGLTRGYPRYVPISESDMIFAAICEEFGAIFGIGIILLFVLVFYRGINIALRSKRRYYGLLAVGFTVMPAFQAFLILGGVIKLLPLTGVTLPFVSYGGSSVIVSLSMMGVLQWTAGQTKKE